MASEFQRGLLQGVKQGEAQQTKKILDWLEAKYLDPKIKRGSEEGNAILELARELSKAVRDGSL